MALNDAWLQVCANAGANAITHVSLHTADPGIAGTTAVIAGGRFAIDLNATSGDISLASAVEAVGLTALAAVAFLGFWSASTGGTYYGSAPRSTGDAAVNAAGEYTITGVTIPGSSS